MTRPDAEPITSDGLLVQRSVLPAWSPRVVLVAAAVAVALVGLWFAVLKPTVQSTAKEAAQVETKELSQEVAEVKTQASEAAQTAEKAEKVANVAAGVSPKPSASPSPTTDTGKGNGNGPGGQAGTLDNADPETAADFRVATSASPTTANEFTLSTYRPAEKKVLWVTDIVLQNPHGDAGLLQVRRGDTVLLETGLNNFRDLDYHFVQPLRFSAGQPVTVAVKCANPGTTACTPAAYFAGQLVPVAPTPSPSPSR